MIKRMIVLVVVLIGLMVWGDETSLIPTLDLEPTKLSLTGYASGFYTENANKEYTWNNLRLRPNWQITDKMSMFGEFNLAYDNENGFEDNWLRVLTVSCKVNENWKISAGRLFLAAGMVTPAPFTLETVSYNISDPMNCYAWGVQTIGQWTNWTLATDISGKSGLVFDQEECWNDIEWSGRLTRKLGPVKLGLTSQIAETSQKFALDCQYQPTEKLNFRGAVYQAYRDELDNWTGAFLLATYRLQPWLEVHSQIDEREVGTTRDVILTNGLRLLIWKERLTLTTDYESIVSGKRDDRLLVRAQIRF